MSDSQERIADSFNRHFEEFGLRIAPEDVTLGARRFISERGLSIAYRVIADDGGLPSLEFYAGGRKTEDRHGLIWADGVCQPLEAFQRLDPSSEDAVRICEELRAKGILYPESFAATETEVSS